MARQRQRSAQPIAREIEQQTDSLLDKIIEEQGSYAAGRVLREYAAAVAELEWGQNLSPAMQAVVAKLCADSGLHPSQITLFGNKPFPMAEAYLHKAAEIPEYDGVEWEDIIEDEIARKFWGVPEFAKAAYVCVVHWKGGRPVREAGWAPRTLAKNERGNYLDSPGVVYPHGTARTRAARRALRLRVPVWSRRAEALEKQLEELGAQADAIAAREEGQRKPAAYPPTAFDPYGDQQPPASLPAASTVEELTAGRVEPMKRVVVAMPEAPPLPAEELEDRPFGAPEPEPEEQPEPKPSELMEDLGALMAFARARIPRNHPGLKDLEQFAARGYADELDPEDMRKGIEQGWAWARRVAERYDARARAEGAA